MSSLQNFSLTKELSSSEPNTSPKDTPLAFRVIVGIIAVITVIANSFLIFLLYKQRHMLKKPYNLIVLYLAIVDTLTGLFMFLTPKMIFSVQYYPSSFRTPVACYLLNSQYLIMTLAKLSITLVAFMAFSRWLSITHPFTYRFAFNRKHVYIYSIIISFIEMAFASQNLIVMSYESGKCQRLMYPAWSTKEATNAWTIIYIVLTFILPVILCWLMFVHIYVYLRRWKYETTNKGFLKRRKSLLRMCVVTVLLMTLCWAPSEINLLIAFSGLELSISGRVQMQILNITKTLGLFNSCVNPFIYCLTNRVYRNEFIKVMNVILRKRGVVPGQSNDIELKEAPISIQNIDAATKNPFLTLDFAKLKK